MQQPQPLRLVSHEASDSAVRSSLASNEQRVDSISRCDRYEPCSESIYSDAPGSMRYADYLERQNQRKPVEHDRKHPAVPAKAAKTTPTTPVDSGLSPKLGEIPNDAGVRLDVRVRTAYQVMRYAPAGSLVDVTL